MAPSLVEKYELILAADPRSRVFVELARSLVDVGEHARAIEVCRAGIEHHPDSILAQVLWSRALLGLGKVEEALAQLDAAIEIEPGNPYAYNLASDALIESGLDWAALPVLRRAAELQPGDERVRARLEEASRRAEAQGRSGAGMPRTRDAAPEPAPAREAPESGPGAISGSPPSAASPPAGSELAAPAPPPLPQEPASPPPVPAAEAAPRLALDLIPGTPTPRAGGVVRTDPAETARIVAEFEEQLRQKLGAPEPPRGFVRRNLVPIAISAAVVAAAAAGGVTYLTVRRNNRDAEVKAAVEAAKKGLARDTLGSLREASRVLQEARELDPRNRDAISLSAEIAALLWTDFGDEDARALAEKLAATGRAGEGGLAARYLLAATPAARAAAAAPIASAPARAGPLLQALAGRILLARGDTHGALRRFELAARASPPLLRAIADRADHEREQGELELALADYRAALAAHPTHPRSAIGAAEARLALGREIPVALRSLAAVEADRGSPPATAERARFEIAYARCLAASGDAAAAAQRLERAGEKLGTTPSLAAALAEVELDAGALDRAEAQADRAVRLAPRNAPYRVLLARVQIARGRNREALRTTEGLDAREAHLWRGIARYELREYAPARGELERTRRDGRMPVEAAAYLALCDFGLGKEAAARALLERLASADKPHPTVLVALGHLELARHRPEQAEARFRSAIARDPTAVEAHCALGRLLLARGRPKEAAASLEQAIRLNPFHREARIALADARLAARDFARARIELEHILADEPRDADVLRRLSAVHLAAREPAEARAAAERAIAAEPRNADALLAAARAALAQGDTAAARRYAERALKVSPRGDPAGAARQLLADARRPRSRR